MWYIYIYMYAYMYMCIYVYTYMYIYIYIHINGILLSHKKEWSNAICTTWMDLESITGEGNGNPLQYPCLESSMDRGACWATVHGVAQSWTRLKRLSSSREYHTKGRKPKTNNIWYHLYVNLKEKIMTQMNLFAKERETDRYSKKKNKKKTNIWIPKEKEEYRE